MKAGRYFYSVAAIILLLITFKGFQPFYLAGEGMGGRKISPQILPLVIVHGTAMTAWVVLFLVQAMLISARSWSALAIAPVITVTGFMVAIQSVRRDPSMPFWGMDYRQFLLIMLTEITLFTLFVFAGILTRKRPEIHRTMMLLATLSILAGATVRMPILFPIFGEGGWIGIFGPIFSLGAVFLLVRSLLRHGVDRWFAAGYVSMIVLYVAASKVAVSGVWSQLAKAIFNT